MMFLVKKTLVVLVSNNKRIINVISHRHQSNVLLTASYNQMFLNKLMFFLHKKKRRTYLKLRRKSLLPLFNDE